MWAQGMEGWRAMKTIPQLKWGLIATGTAILDETNLAALCLNMLIRITEYYPPVPGTLTPLSQVL